MEEIEDSCKRAHEYPSNLLRPDLPPLMLDGIRQELQRQSDRLFCPEEDASVDFLEVRKENSKYDLRTLHKDHEIWKSLRKTEPLLRMIFVYAPSSRDRLNISQEMAQQILSYHQVMPSFVDAMLPFGFSENGRECNTTSFHGRTQLSSPCHSAPLRLVEHCYGLRAVEPNRTHQEWPWSVRLCSVYHSLDRTTECSMHGTWIVIKANRLIEKLVTDAMTTTNQSEKTPKTNESDAMASAATIHTLIASWSGSNWSWYLTFLENKLQGFTKQTLSFTAQTKSIVEPDFEDTHSFTEKERIKTPLDDEKLEKRTLTFSQTWSSVRRSYPYERRSNRKSNAKPIAMRVYDRQFSFNDIPELHTIEERANEALDAMSNNQQVLEDLRTNFLEAFNHQSSGTHDNRRCEDNHDFKGKLFAEAIERVQKDLRTQQSRARQLLRLLRARKALMQRILDYNSMEANRSLAEEASKSARNMEDIAVKTKLETVSMRIITLVTLFFLPGTFISTLMSTPIVTFRPGSPSTSDSNISMGALGFYCAVSLPLVVLTFVAWGVVYWWENRKEARRRCHAHSPRDVV